MSGGYSYNGWAMPIPEFRKKWQLRMDFNDAVGERPEPEDWDGDSWEKHMRWECRQENFI